MVFQEVGPRAGGEGPHRTLAATEAAYLDMTDHYWNPSKAGSDWGVPARGAHEGRQPVRDEPWDSRAIVVQRPDDGDNGCALGTMRMEDIRVGLEIETRPAGCAIIGLKPLQLSTDDSTSIYEEVKRIKREHPDDDQCIVNDRVKSRLKVTQAFAAGYLKQIIVILFEWAKLKNGLLEMFRNDYIGDAQYISCTPSLCHHKLTARNQFLVLSSDGLYT